METIQYNLKKLKMKPNTRCLTVLFKPIFQKYELASLCAVSLFCCPGYKGMKKGPLAPAK